MSETGIADACDDIPRICCPGIDKHSFGTGRGTFATKHAFAALKINLGKAASTRDDDMLRARFQTGATAAARVAELWIGITPRRPQGSVRRCADVTSEESPA